MLWCRINPWLKVRQIQKVFSSRCFFKKTNEQISCFCFGSITKSKDNWDICQFCIFGAYGPVMFALWVFRASWRGGLLVLYQFQLNASFIFKRTHSLMFGRTHCILFGRTLFEYLCSEGHIALCLEGHFSEHDKKNLLNFKLSHFNITVVWVSRQVKSNP